MSKWIKKRMWEVTAYLREEEEHNWSEPWEKYYTETREEAEQLREKLLSGQHEDYGELVEDCLISDEMIEEEFFG